MRAPNNSGGLADGAPGRQQWLRATGLVVAYCAVTAILAAPFVDYAHLASACYDGDAYLVLWTLAWDSHAIMNRLPLFDANMFYPAAHALAYNEHLFGLSLFYLPLYAISRNPILAYNVIWLAAWILNGVAAHLLARRYVRDGLAAFVGGLVFAFSFFRMHHFAHLGLAWTFWIPLSLLALERWYRDPGWRRMAWLLVTVALQVLTNWYLAVLVLVADTLLLACLLLFAGGHPRDRQGATSREPWFRRRVARRCIQGAAGLVALGATVWPFASYYRGLAPAGAAQAANYSADTAAYLVPPLYTWPGRWVAQMGWAHPRWLWGERTLFLGYTALALSLVGAAMMMVPSARRRLPDIGRPALIFFPVLALGALALSFGPSAALTAGGHVGWMPFDWFSRMPGVGGLRVPARFAVLVVLAMSVFAAAGTAWLHQRYGRAARVATVLLIPLLLSEWYVVGFVKPQSEPIPEVYHYLARVSARGVVSLPIHRGAEWYLEPGYLYYSTAHWHPIVNGAGRSEPADYYWIAGHMMAFAGPNSARTMRRLGIDYVVLHAARPPAGGMLEEALHSSDFHLEARFGSDYLFRVNPR